MLPIIIPSERILKPELDWLLCHCAMEQWSAIVLRRNGTMASPSRLETIHTL